MSATHITSCPAWWKQPGECHDKNGYPIHQGDLVRSFHFTGPRRRKYWLYHVIRFERGGQRGHGYLRMMNTAELEPTMAGGGGNPLLDHDLARDCEIISGHGPGDIMDWHDRPRKKETTP